MADTDPTLSIRTTGAFNREEYLLESLTEIHLGRAAPRRRKTYALPLDLGYLMPLTWDLKSDFAEDKEEPAEYLGATEKIEAVKPATRAAMTANFIRLGGPGSVVPADGLSRVLRNTRWDGIDDNKVPNEPLAPLADGEALKIHPLKLLIAALSIEDLATDDSDGRDMFDLVFDKIALAALLPAALSPSVWPKALFGQDTGLPTPEQLDAALVDSLAGLKPLTEPRERELLEGSITVAVPAYYWTQMIAHTAGPDPRSGDDPSDPHGTPFFCILPLDDLDDLLTEHLSGLLPKLLSGRPEIRDQWQQIRAAQKDGDPLWSERRPDYGLFYPTIERLFESRRRALELLKLRYRSEADDPQLPVIDDIDMRGPLWAREAVAITSEMNIAALRYANAKGKLKGTDIPVGTFDALATELRNANHLWFEAKRRLELLREEVQEAGYNLTLKPEVEEASNIDVGQFYRLTQTRQITKRVSVKRSRLVRYTERYSVRRCRRRLFSHRCWTEYRDRHRTRRQGWIEIQTKRLKTEVDVKLDYEPIQTYLERELPSDALTPAQAQQLRTDLALPDGAPLLNQHKEIHLFHYEGQQLVDEDGIPLHELLSALELERDLDEGEVSRRCRVLLLVPVVRRSTRGDLEVERYLAIHNPLKGRGSNTPPRIFLSELYSVELAQDAGHWLGGLSHIVSLFPGESRRIKLVTETRSHTSTSTRSDSTRQSSSERSADVKQQLRDELEHESRQAESKSSSLSASAGASWGSGSASVKGTMSSESSSSSRDVAKALHDRVANTMSRASESNEVRFESARETTEDSLTSSDQLVEFRNVNEGAAVNYKFFQVMHRFRATTRLKNARVIVEYPDPVIPGIESHETRSYALDEIEQVLPEIIEEERTAVRQAIEELVRKRCPVPPSDEDTAPLRVDTAAVVAEDEWFVNTGAFFVESEVSRMGATEPYVDLARDAELRAQNANAEKLEREAAVLESEVARNQAIAAAIESGKIVYPEVEHLSVEERAPEARR